MNTSEQILAEILARSREVYKEENKEIQNYASRLSGVDGDGVKVSTRPAFESVAKATELQAVTSSLLPLESVTSSLGESGSVITPRELTSRYSGISVQHNKTKKGVKLSLTLQQPYEQNTGYKLEITAELKRYDRLREIKPRADDSDNFNLYLQNTKKLLQDSPNKNVAIGRAHIRGKRAAWIYDTLVVAMLENDQVTTVVLWTEGEEYQINLDQEPSESQQKFYHSQGYFGTVVFNRNKAPRMSELPRTRNY